MLHASLPCDMDYSMAICTLWTCLIRPLWADPIVYVYIWSGRELVRGHCQPLNIASQVCTWKNTQFSFACRAEKPDCCSHNKHDCKTP